jgi:hypothetical protein
MKSKGVHEGKSGTINLSAEMRKESSRETSQGGSASPEDDVIKNSPKAKKYVGRQRRRDSFPTR